MTLLYYYKPVYPVRSLEVVVLPSEPKKKRRKTFEVIRTEEKPSDSRAIEALADGLLSDVRNQEIVALRSEQVATTEAARRARESAIVEGIRQEALARMASEHAADKEKRRPRNLREEKEMREIHALLDLMQRMH